MEPGAGALSASVNVSRELLGASLSLEARVKEALAVYAYGEAHTRLRDPSDWAASLGVGVRW